MNYSKVVEGIFIKRPNRFIAHVLVDGVEEVVHVRNTGRCKELLTPGVKVILEDCQGIATRKTRYSLVSVWKENMLVNMDSQIPNAVVFQGLMNNKISEIENVIEGKREVKYGNSRFDIFFKTEDTKGFMEVKGVTLEDNGICRFPDAPTDRGAKHVLEMVEAVKEGYMGYIMFLVQMSGPSEFRLNWNMDKKFADAIKFAHENGVTILAYDSIVKDNEILLGKALNIDLED